MDQKRCRPIRSPVHGLDDARTDPPPLLPTSSNSRPQLPIPTSEGTGCLPGQRLPSFFGRDDENVLSWLQKIDMALEAARFPENSKPANMAPLIRGDAHSWLYPFMRGYPADRHPTYTEFKDALIRKYESSEVHDDHLRSKLQTIKLGPQGLRGVNDYVFRFRSIEIQIHEMAFKDQLHFFMKSLPNDLALYLRDQKHMDMENIYESAWQWASRQIN